MKISYENVVRSKRRAESFVVFDKLSRLTLAFLSFLFSLLFAISFVFRDTAGWDLLLPRRRERGIRATKMFLIIRVEFLFVPFYMLFGVIFGVIVVSHSNVRNVKMNFFTDSLRKNLSGTLCQEKSDGGWKMKKFTLRICTPMIFSLDFACLQNN